MTLTAVALYASAFVKARLTQRPELRAGIETMMAGLIGTAVCWGIGRAVAHVVGGGAGGSGAAVNGAAFKHALVTGASSGMGRGLALALAARGAHVVAAARRRERLDELVREVAAAGGSAEALVLDVADGDATYAAVRAVDARRPLDLVIANAGIGGITPGRSSTGRA